jgi:hypothetical protein
MSIIYINPYQFGLAYDADAQSYITAVETADGQALEVGVKDAINAFVVGCKSDGIWNAIKASCILAGARTLAGALVPLAGAAPTNNYFVSADYDRETGLEGDGSTKYLDSNGTAATLTQQNSAHIAVYLSSTTGSNNQGDSSLAGLIDTQTSGGWLWLRGDTQYAINNKGTATSTRAGLGLVGGSRSTNSAFTTRSRSISDTVSATSAPASNLRVCIFAIDQDNSIVDYSSSRLAFYSIGESLNLALLDARVTTLINAIGAAIP